MTYVPKKATCPLCNGVKKVQAKKAVFVFGSKTKEISEETQQLAEAMANDDTCPHCHGVGEVSVAPYNNGDNAKLSQELLSQLVEAGNLMRCVGEPTYVQAVANQAAKITLPDELVETYVGYWADPGREVTLGVYTRQIAQSAQELAMQTYGNLGDPIYAGARPAP